MSMTRRTIGWLAATLLSFAALGAQAQAQGAGSAHQGGLHRRPRSRQGRQDDPGRRHPQGDRAGRPEGPAVRQLPAHDGVGGRPLLAPGDAGAAEAPPGRVQAAARSHLLGRVVAGERRADGRAEADALRADRQRGRRPHRDQAARAIRSSSTTASRRPATSWKIYDVNVLGVWLVENYRNSFAQEIGANGIDGLIAKMAERNKSAAAGGAKS